LYERFKIETTNFLARASLHTRCTVGLRLTLIVTVPSGSVFGVYFTWHNLARKLEGKAYMNHVASNLKGKDISHFFDFMVG